MSDLRVALAKLVENKQDAITVYPARLGDGSGRVIAGAGLVYVRVADTVTIAACASVPPIHDLNVWVGYDPIQTNILRVMGQRDITGKQDVVPAVSAHATMHEFMGAGSLGGTDVVKVQLQQFMPLAVWPYQGLKVIIYPGVVWLGTQYKLIADTNPYGKPVPKVLDFTQYPAPNSNKEMYYLIGINNTGDIQIISGNQVDLGTITLADIPAVPDDMLYPLAAVRRSIDQDAIVINRESTDIVDLRYPLAHKHKASAINDGILDSERLPLFSVDKRGAVPPPGLISGKVLRDDGTWTAAGMGDMTKVMYDTDNDGVVDAAESVDWNGVQNKPSTYPPSAHTHPLSDVTGHNKSAHDALGIDADTVDGQHASAFAPSSHTHTPSEVGLGNVTNDAQLKRAANDFTAFTEKTTPTDNDLVLSEDSAASYAKKKITLGNIYLWFKSRFDGIYAALNHNHDASYYTKTQLNTSGAGGQVHWNNVTTKPSTYPPSTHTHAASDTTSGTFDPARIPNLDASKITSGTLSTDRYSALADLQAENKIGLVTGRIPNADQVRFYTPTSEAHDFTSTSLPSGWSWAGSPFVTPTQSVEYGTLLKVIPGATSRSYMYKPSGNDISANGIMWTADAGSYIGCRYDDGTDNNYAECCLYCNALDDIRIMTRVRTGGGSVTTWTGTTNYVNLRAPTLYVYPSGTLWSNWTAEARLLNGLSMIAAFGISGLAFTPTRRGIVIYTVANWAHYYIDAIY